MNDVLSAKLGEVDEDAERRAAQEADPYYMPMENKGGGRMSPNYRKATAEQIFNHLNDRENASGRDTLDGNIADGVKRAEDKVKDVERREPKGKGRSDKSLTKWEKELSEARAQMEKWREVERMRREQKAAEGDDSDPTWKQAYDEFNSSDEEPVNLEDYVARHLYGTKFKWKDKEFVRLGGRTHGLGGHLGLSKSDKERRAFFGWIDEKNGSYPESVAEGLYANMPDWMRERYDTMEILDAVLNVVGRNPRPRDMVVDYVKRLREQNRDMDEYYADEAAGARGFHDAGEMDAYDNMREREAAGFHDVAAAGREADGARADLLADARARLNDANAGEYEKQAARTVLRFRVRDDGVLSEQEKDVPLHRRTRKSYTRNDGTYREGLEDELQRIERRLRQLSDRRSRHEDDTRFGENTTQEFGAETAVENIPQTDRNAEHDIRRLTELHNRAEMIREELSWRDREKARLKSQYGINESGDISIDNVAKMFHDLNRDKAVGVLFDRVYDSLKSLKIDFRFSDNTKVNAHGQASALRKMTFYNWDSFTRARGDQEKARTLLHEMIHNATAQAIMCYEEPILRPLLSPSQRQAAKLLIDIYEKVSAAGLKQSNGKPFYGLKDVYEMVAELANPEFRDALKNVEYNHRSYWEIIKDSIKKLFGLDVSVRPDNTLVEASRALDKMLDDFGFFNRVKFNAPRFGYDLYNKFKGRDSVDATESRLKDNTLLDSDEPHYRIRDDERRPTFYSNAERAVENVKQGKALFRERRAPNGKESNLDERQYDEVRTRNFKKWFGDWENEPEQASKVVDANGEPLVVYHQTNRKQYINQLTACVCGCVMVLVADPLTTRQTTCLLWRMLGGGWRVRMHRSLRSRLRGLSSKRTGIT